MARLLLRAGPLLLALTFATLVAAQEMEPRAYSRAPVGTQFVLLTYAYQSGDLLTDSALPLRDVNVKLSMGSAAYGRTFGLFGKQASATLLLPYLKGIAKGTVFEAQREAERSGLGDLRMRFTANLRGSPAMTVKEFASYKPRTVVGASLTIVAPTGQYDPRRLVNLGTNRWAFKPELGMSKPADRWTFEVAGGAWFFTTNDNFFGGQRREQKPLLSLQGSVIYTLRPRMWVAMHGTYFTGGRTVVNGLVNDDRQSNSRMGATYSLPLTQKQSLKFAWAKGVTTRFGGNMHTVAVGWQYTWLD